MEEHAQTPKELLEKLRGVSPPTRIRLSESDPSHLEAILAFQESLGHDRKEMERSIDEFFHEGKDLSEVLFNKVVDKLPDSLKELRELFSDDRIFAIGTLGLHEVNAQAIRADNGGWLILLNDGLYTFLYKVARALATRFVAQGENGEQPFGETTASFEDTCRYIMEVFAWYKGATIPFGPDFPIHPAQMMMANLLATHAEQFVICHELAHHIMGHTENENQRTILVSGISVESSDWSWNQEYEADQIGLNLLLNGENEGDIHESILRYTGADYFLQVMSLYEELAELPVSETHPPSHERLNNLREFANSQCSDEASKRALFQNAFSIEKLFAEVRRILLEPSAEQIQLAERQAQSAVEKLDQLLDKCSGGYVPNYYNFYPAAFKLLEEGPTHIIASDIEMRLEQYREKLEPLSTSGIIAEDRIIFQKMKLLIGFVEQLPSEIKNIIYK